MLSDFSIAVVDSLLQLQDEEGMSGNLLELGCYKGKTALLLGLHLSDGEYVDLVDIYDQLERKILEDNNIKFYMQTANTENRQKNLKLKRKGYRFIHCDTSHTYANTLADLNLSRKLVSDKGVICVDDFANLNYPGVIPAVYRFLFKRKKFVMFLMTEEKAYICHKSQSKMYNDYVINKLPSELLNRGYKVTLARTDNSIFSSTIYIRGTMAGESDYYSGEVFSDLFQSSPYSKKARIMYQYRKILRTYPSFDRGVIRCATARIIKTVRLLTALRKTF
jgi:hypothetical protein